MKDLSPHSQNLSVPAWLLHQCRRHANAPALLIRDGEAITHGDLASRVARTASAIRARGLAPGQKVAFAATESAEALTCYLAASHAGLVLVPMNTAWGPLMTQLHFEIAQCEAVILDDDHRTMFTQMESPLAAVLSITDLAASGKEAQPIDPASDVDDDFALFFSGGIDSEPYAAVHSHRSYLAACLSLESFVQDLPLMSFAHVLPTTHAGGMFLLPTIRRGAPSTLLPAGDLAALRDVASQGAGVTATMVVPPMLTQMSGWDVVPELVVYGTSPVTETQLESSRAFTRTARVDGIAEAPNSLFWITPEQHAGLDLRRLSALGYPAPDARLIIGSDSHPQELCVAGPFLAPGRVHHGKRTNRRPGDYLATGHLVTQDADGLLWSHGSLREIAYSGGLHLYPTITERLLHYHPTVTDARVEVRIDEKWGQVLHANVTVEDPRVGETELREWSRTQLGRAMAPKTFSVMNVDSRVHQPRAD